MNVALDAAHFQELLQAQVEPPAVRATSINALRAPHVLMGFPEVLIHLFCFSIVSAAHFSYQVFKNIFGSFVCFNDFLCC